MAQVLIDDAILTDIGDAIRDKINSEEQFYPDEMAKAITGIPQTINTITNNMVGFLNYYLISSDDYNSIDLSNYAAGDIIIVVPSLEEE